MTVATGWAVMDSVAKGSVMVMAGWIVAAMAKEVVGSVAVSWVMEVGDLEVVVRVMAEVE